MFLERLPLLSGALVFCFKNQLAQGLERVPWRFPFYFLNTTQLCDQGTGRPKSDTTLPSASLYQE